MSPKDAALYTQYPKRWALILLAFLGLFFCLGIYGIVTGGTKSGFEYWLAWFALLFFGSSVLLATVGAFWRAPRLVATSDGIVVRKLFRSESRAKWAEINDIRLTRHKMRRVERVYLSIFLTEEARKLRSGRRPWSWGGTRYGDLALGNVDISDSLDDAASTLRKLWERYR